MNVQKLIEAAHATAVEKGWWESGDRDPDEAEALIHSELAEATEAAREGKLEMWFDEKGKPEGYVVELADAAIRAADLLGRKKWMCKAGADDILDVLEELRESEFRDPIPLVNRLHISVAHITMVREEGEEGEYCLGLEYLILACMAASRMLNLDFQGALAAKLAYNKSRPYRHGGKKA